MFLGFLQILVPFRWRFHRLAANRGSSAPCAGLWSQWLQVNGTADLRVSLGGGPVGALWNARRAPLGAPRGPSEPVPFQVP